MARKKKEDGGSKGAPEWMATFSDLMNLLLCFFVLLFAMSSVDADKFDQMAASMTSSFSLFSGGGASVGDGTLISSGTSQLSQLDDYYSSMGQQSDDTGDDVQGNESSSDGTEDDDGSQDSSGTDTSSTGQLSDEQLEELLSGKNMTETLEMYDSITEELDNTGQQNNFSVNVDANGRYVEILISGTLLFDPGEAELKSDAKLILSNLGNVLKIYEGNLIEIIGHTDNVPLSSGNQYESNDILSSARAISAKDYLVNEKGLDVSMMKWSGKGEYEPIASNLTVDGRARNRRIEIRIYNSLSSY